ncbi:ribonuclease E activity regulator RraA [Zobellia nedashkovskayae]
MFTTADLWDENIGIFECASPLFKSFGNKKTFSGKISTLKLFEDNSLVRKKLETKGGGKVLVIYGGGSLRCALVGDQLATLALKNNWSGIIVNGCIRDSKLINTMDVGVRALNTCPVKSVKRNMGENDIPVNFGGVTFVPDYYVYVDTDGILLSEHAVL